MRELHRELWLARPREEVFAFFAEAGNLQRITPPWLDFRVLDTKPIIMRAGARIHYRLRVHGIPLKWESEITVWEPPERFVDEQRRGPYRRWRHEHRFQQRNGNTLIIDRVEYAVLGGWLIEWLLVRRDVENIFDYREKTLKELFEP